MQPELRKVLLEISKSYGSCILLEWFPKSRDIAILWEHYSFLNPYKDAPRVFIGGKYERPKIHEPKPNTNIFYIYGTLNS